MRYEKEYIEVDNKKEFIRLLLVKYNNIKATTATRRFYELQQKLGKKVLVVGDKREPSIIKKLMIEDMKRMKINITPQLLKNHGFSYDELNWLKSQGVFK